MNLAFGGGIGEYEAMKVFLDERPLSVQRPTLAAALAAGRSAADDLHRVIVEAKLDGVAIPDAELEQPTERDLGQAELRFITATPALFVSTTLHEIADALDGVRATQRAAARAFQRGELNEAFSHLSSSLGVWDAVRKGVEQGPALLNRRLADLRVGAAASGGGAAGVPLAEHLDQLATRLSGLRTALAAQDWSTLADELEGEFEPAAARWSAILRELATQLSISPGTEGRR